MKFLLKLIFCIFIITTPFTLSSQSISIKKHNTTPKRTKSKKLFHRKTTGEKTEKYKWKKMRRAEKANKKAVKDYQKRVNSDNDLGTDKETYKRIKKSRKQSKRINKNKPQEGYFKRTLINMSKNYTRFKIRFSAWIRNIFTKKEE